LEFKMDESIEEIMGLNEEGKNTIGGI